MISIKEAGKIYDEFETKDMPRETFIGKLRGLTSQNLMQRDLKAMINQKQETRTRQAMAAARKQQIDKAVQG